MAYVNVKEWSVEQVTDWLKGLDNVIFPYIKSFLNNGVTGHQLLNLRVDDLEHLGVTTLGHQEIILESVELIRNFHYELDKENLQTLALKLSCAANSLNRELQFRLRIDENDTVVLTQHLSDVHNIISTIKPLVCWLDRSPFYGITEYNEMKKTFLELAFEMATNAHRGIFSENPVKSIWQICEKLTKMADTIIQEISDPMILQPATLALCTLKKKEQDIGFFILPSNSAVHQIVDIKKGSPAHMATKIEEGDEIVQVNYQTVVGWQEKKVMLLLQESPPEIVLTLKKRPRHTKVYGQIYMKPYRLPSKKRAAQYSRWNENLPSPRLLTIHDLPQISLSKVPNNTESTEIDIETSSGSDSEPPDSPLDSGGRLYPIKPRSVLQRRNTVTGAMPSDARTSAAAEQYWEILKKVTSTHSSSYHLPTEKFEDEINLRDKSASCSYGLEYTQRPTTIIGIAHKNGTKTDFSDKSPKKNVNFDDTKTIINDDRIELKYDDKRSISTASLCSLNDESIEYIDEAEDLQDRSKMTYDKESNEEKTASISVKTIKESISELNKPLKTGKPLLKDTVLEDVHVDNIIKKFDTVIEKRKIMPRTYINKVPAVPVKPVILPRTIKNRGKLDKSHSTPAYDLTSEDDLKTNEDFNVSKSHDNSFCEIKPIPDTAIKYELGIPILHDVVFNQPIVEARKNIEVNKMEVPPKPPPRTNIPDIYKRKLPDANEFNKSSNEKKTELEMEASADVPIFEPASVSTPIRKDDILRVDTQSKGHKTSPTNLVVRAIYTGKSKAGKKKNSALVAKRRKVSVNDVSPGEIQGYLHQRLRSRHNQNVHWEKRWFVLNQHCLYGFKSKESIRAECYIFLAGFTVTIANEVKSRSNAFKVYHTGTVFYFSVESEETLSAWLESISAAITNSDPTSSVQILYSETDDDSESEAQPKSSTLEKNTEGLRKFNSLKKFTSKKRNDSSVSGSTSLDRKWFFNKSNSPKNALPVPTSQFRSYRKIPASTTIGNFTSHIPNFANKLEASTLETSIKISTSNLSVDSIEQNKQKSSTEISPTNLSDIASGGLKDSSLKPKIYNHLHSSNPTLCNTEYTTFPFNLPKPKHTTNLGGFVTLEELMNREADEKREHYETFPPINPNLIRPDVVYGEVPIRPNRDIPDYRNTKKTHLRTSSDCTEPKKESSCFGKRSSSIKSNSHSLISKNKNEMKSSNNSLPRTPKSAENSFLIGKQRSNSSKSLSKNKEKSYEMIYCPQTTADVHFAQNRTLDGRMFHDTPKKNLKSAQQYTPMALPLTPDEKLKYNPQNAFELNLDSASSQKSGKFKFFSKQDSKKEKKSPKLPDSNEIHISWPTSTTINTSDSSYGIPVLDISDNHINNSPPSIDYPGMEYPPVFEPETYSLANPQGTLLRKQSRKN